MLKLLIHILRTLLTRCHAAGRGVVRGGISNHYNQTLRNPVYIDRPGSRRSEGTTLRRFLGRASIALAMLLGLTIPAAALDINNTAQFNFSYGGTVILPIDSNTVTVVSTPPPSVATAEFLSLTIDPLGSVPAITEYSSSDPAITTPPDSFQSILPQPGAGTFGSAVAYAEGELVMIRITDADQNLDPTAIDTVLIRLDVPLSADSELLRLYEEGINSGIFIGYIPAGAVGTTLNNGFLAAVTGALI